MVATDTPYDPLTPRWTPLYKHEQQAAMRESTAQVRVMPCRRRSGKSELAKRHLVERMLDIIPGCVRPRYVYGGPTQDQARDIAWQDLLDLIPDRWIIGGKNGSNVSYSRLEIQIANGASLRVVGLDKPHRIEGKYLNGFVGDEWSDVRPGTFDKVIRPMLGDYHGWAILCGVPKRQGVGARWYRNLCTQITAGSYPDAAHFSWPASDVLDPAEVAKARETMAPKDFAEQYEAQWVNAGGGIYYAFNPEFNCPPCGHRNNMPILVGSDFNVDPMCWVLAHRIGEDLEVFDELILHDSNTPHALNELWRRWGHHQGGWQFYGDPSSRARKTSATQSDYAHIWNDQRFQKARRTLHYPSGPAPVEDRYSAVNARLCNADETRRLFIDPRCTTLIEDLETCSYREGTREPAFDKDHFHASDALGYIVSRIWPIRFNVGGSMQSVIVGGGPKEFMQPIDPGRLL
jgi:hypothetical protein